jgi:hypothetical protein
MMMNSRPEVRGAHIGFRSHFQGTRAALLLAETDFIKKPISKILKKKKDI